MKKGSAKHQIKDSQRFFLTLRKRIDQYFKENNIDKQANGKMKLKTVILLSIYIIPFALILTNSLNPWIMLLLAVIMGVGMAGIGMSVMHDSNHGSYSRNQTINNILGSTIYLIGGNKFNWKTQHNMLHHTFTNVYNHDEDIENGGMVRLSPHSNLKKAHRFQHIYAFALYGLMTISWCSLKDFNQMRRYFREGVSHDSNVNKSKEAFKLILTKIFYYALFIALPLLVLDISWWQFLIGFFTMHFIAGFILAVVFQLAHIVEGPEQPVPDENGSLSNTWAIHQLHTTANFSRKSKLISWFVGGLNFQIEHHLFPNICHIHYGKLSDIVKETALEFKIPYFEYDTFMSALASHYRVLKQLGTGTFPVKTSH